MNGAEVLLRTLLASGINVSFMNPGTSEMQFVAALDRVPGMRGVLCLFEGVCSGAADGYARMLGRPASTLLHLGPGLANGLANFHNARKARSPIVSVVGEHSTQHMRYDAPLSADIAAFARGVSDDIITPSAAPEVGAAASAAIAAACRPPGQIAHLIVPADFSWSEAGEPGPATSTPLRREPSDATIRNICDLLQQGPAVTFVLGGNTLTERGLNAAGRLAAKFGVRICANRNAGRMQSGQGRFQPVRIPYFPEPAEALLAATQHLVLVESAAP
ncbi:MAG: acetolactate synthase large subunit, partial [Bryobacteraceae bacterium]|nr:acetolactate synthase large subunit [Bryobacteraceae bacterium]